LLHGGSEREIDSAFRVMVRQRTDALLVAHDPFLFARREQIVTLAAYCAIPAIYEFREFATRLLAASRRSSHGQRPRKKL
jgi:hypothetical protein